MNTQEKTARRIQRKRRVRARIFGTAQRPRLVIFRSNTRMTAQVIDDEKRETLVAVSTADQKGKTLRDRVAAAGAAIAAAAKGKGIDAVVFDRGGYLYTGNVKTFADAAREAGLTF